MTHLDLFGNVIDEFPALTGTGKPRKTFAKGYAKRPGSGPAGETCKTCDHCQRLSVGNKTFYKCGANKPNWTHSVNTDIRIKSPACILWTQGYQRIGNGRKRQERA